MVAMRRTQIYLDADLAGDLDRLAHKRGTTKAELIRQAARRFLAQEGLESEDPILGIIGMGRSGQSDISEDHDRALASEKLDHMTS